MLQSWRWFGPTDPVLLDHIRQAGAAGIVTALHETYDGQPWRTEDILRRKAEIEAAGFAWSVVESIPIPQEIKRDGATARKQIEAFKASMRAVADAGLEVICYNFMPVVDWTRTDLTYRAPNGGLALRFDPIDFAAYDVFCLKRIDAADDYPPDLLDKAEQRHSRLTESEVASLENNIISGLPGAEATHSRDGIRDLIASFDGLGPQGLRRNLTEFLGATIPLADELGLRMCLHPDDPPYSLFGLPRVLSTADDYRSIFAAQPSLANGITFCTGSLGARADNDLPAIAREFAPRIHFAHLRNVTREPGGGFYEADHLNGSTDMIAVVDALIREEKRRREEGRPDHRIPMRPDHGHLLLDDIGKDGNPGYSAIGRLKGLAELRGVAKALEATLG